MRDSSPALPVLLHPTEDSPFQRVVTMLNHEIHLREARIAANIHDTLNVDQCRAEISGLQIAKSKIFKVSAGDDVNHDDPWLR